MFKKIAFSLVCLTIFAAAGCMPNNIWKKENALKQGAVGKSDKVQVSLNSATYIKPYDLINGENNRELLAIELKIKNIDKEKTYLNEDWFGLSAKGDDEKISPESIHDRLKELKTLDSGQLSAGSAKTGYIIFPVDTSKKYTLTISPETYGDAEAKEIKINIDPEKYVDTKNITKEAEKAFAAYIDTVFLDKENKNKKLLSDKTIKIGKEKLATGFNDLYKERLFIHNKDYSDEQINQAFDDYRNAQKEKYQYKAKVKGYLPSSVAFDFSAKGISEESVSKKIKDIRNEGMDSSHDYNFRKYEKEAASKFKDILVDMKAEKIELHEPKIGLSKKDGKWSLDLSSDSNFNNTKLQKSFLGLGY